MYLADEGTFCLINVDLHDAIFRKFFVFVKDFNGRI